MGRKDNDPVVCCCCCSANLGDWLSCLLSVAALMFTVWMVGENGYFTWTSVSSFHTVYFDGVGLLWTSFVCQFFAGIAGHLLRVARDGSDGRTWYLFLIQAVVAAFLVNHALSQTASFFWQSKNYVRDVCVPHSSVRDLENFVCAGLHGVRLGGGAFTMLSAGCSFRWTFLAQ
jgi:hypothetical protein